MRLISLFQQVIVSVIARGNCKNTIPACLSKRYITMCCWRKGHVKWQCAMRQIDLSTYPYIIDLPICIFSPSVTIMLQAAMAPFSSRSANYPVFSPSGLTACLWAVFDLSQVLTTLYLSSCSADQHFCKTFWSHCMLESSCIFPSWF